MANAYINIYTGNPTVGKTDGTQISVDGAQTAPLSVTIDAAKAEMQYVKCAVRTEPGYKTSGNTTISFTGTTAAKWAICADNNYTEAAAQAATYTSDLTITDEITNANKIVWIKVSSSTDEAPSKDISVKINVAAVVVTA